MSTLSNSALNRVLIDLGRSFLQYISDAWPWVDPQAQSVQDQVMVISARQRQDVADIVALLNDREQHIDFGTFPTEYTDLQFLALDSIFDMLHKSQSIVCGSIAQGISEATAASDSEAVDLLMAVQIRQNEASASLKELHAELTKKSAPVA
ncbi:MAG: hypothetical protein R3C59_31540 [Planctomycetaceae bacterium]